MEPLVMMASPGAQVADSIGSLEVLKVPWCLRSEAGHSNTEYRYRSRDENLLFDRWSRITIH